MQRLAPGIHDDGDPDTVIVVGKRLQLSDLSIEEYKALGIGDGETAVRVPRALIVEAARGIGEG